MNRSLPTLILNEKTPGLAETKAFIDALSDPSILRSTGGYLFKSCFLQETLHIGITPTISEGIRLHHYDIVVPDGNQLLGGISVHGEFTILFRAETNPLDRKSRERWQLQFTAFAQTLLAHGYSGQGKLDWITRQIIRESEIFEIVPETLLEIRDSL